MTLPNTVVAVGVHQPGAVGSAFLAYISQIPVCRSMFQSPGPSSFHL